MTEDTQISVLAMDAVCEIAQLRVSRVFGKQIQDFRAGQSPAPMTIFPPTPEEVNAVLDALTKARDAGIHAAALITLRAADDAKKEPLKSAMDKLHNEVRALKSTNYALAK